MYLITLSKFLSVLTLIILSKSRCFAKIDAMLRVLCILVSEYLGSDENSFSNNNQNTFPNGTKVAIDYTKGQINISQVLTDFRSTIVAINAPEDVKDEVNLYLGLVEKESKKENPSKEIILANLKNASKVSDAYIASALKKPSDVVEKWIDTLFLQKINLKD